MRPVRKRVAAFDRAAVHAAAQPAHAIGRRSMRERLGNDLAARHALQPVVADGRRRVQSFIHIAGIEQAARLGEMSPHARVAVGLQLEADGQRVGLAIVGAFPLRRDGFRDAQQVLDVVTDFVRDDVGLREVAGRAEALVELAEEGEIEIHLPIGGAVERPNLGASDAARRLRRAVEEHQHGRHVRIAALTEDLAPRVLGVGEHLRNEVCLRVIVADAGRADRLILRHAARRADEIQRVRTRDPGNQQKEYQTAHAAAEGQPNAAHTYAAPIFDIAALASQSHATREMHARYRPHLLSYTAGAWTLVSKTKLQSSPARAVGSALRAHARWRAKDVSSVSAVARNRRSRRRGAMSRHARWATSELSGSPRTSARLTA